MDYDRQSTRQARQSVTPRSVSCLGHLRCTPDAYPDNVEAGEHTVPIVPARAVDEDLVDNDVQTDVSRCGDRRLVGTKHLPPKTTDANARLASCHFETHPLRREWAVLGSCAPPLARDLRQDIIDAEQQPEVSNASPLTPKRGRECRLSRA